MNDSPAPSPARQDQLSTMAEYAEAANVRVSLAHENAERHQERAGVCHADARAAAQRTTQLRAHLETLTRAPRQSGPDVDGGTSA